MKKKTRKTLKHYLWLLNVKKAIFIDRKGTYVIPGRHGWMTYPEEHDEV